MNAIHNQVFDEQRLGESVRRRRIFFRNEGVGSWEINFAAFLADLNTNQWFGYNYQQPGFANVGDAFADAKSLLAYRYNFGYLNLPGASPVGYLALNNNGFGSIDGFTLGFLMTDTALPTVMSVASTTPWAGSDNPNRFFTLDEFFNPAETQVGVVPPALGFTDHLLSAGNSTATYDRYTFYRMLDQLGSDSTPEVGPDEFELRQSRSGLQRRV